MEPQSNHNLKVNMTQILKLSSVSCMRSSQTRLPRESKVLTRTRLWLTLVLTILSSSGVMNPSLSTSNFSKAACDLWCHFSELCSSNWWTCRVAATNSEKSTSPSVLQSIWDINQKSREKSRGKNVKLQTRNTWISHAKQTYRLKNFKNSWVLHFPRKILLQCLCNMNMVMTRSKANRGIETWMSVSFPKG